MQSTKPVLKQELSPSDIKVDEGDQIRLVAKISGYPPPTITWTLNGQPVAIDGDNVVAKADPETGTYELVIKSAKPCHTGKYVIKAVNSEGETESAAQATVIPAERAPAVISGLPDSLAVVEGEKLELAAEIDGQPAPKVEWTKDGQPIRPGDDSAIKMSTDEDGKTHRLSIAEARLEDAGKYGLKASNKFGEAETKADVDVRLRKSRNCLWAILPPPFSQNAVPNLTLPNLLHSCDIAN